MKTFSTKIAFIMQAICGAVSSVALLFAPFSAFAATLSRYPIADGSDHQWFSSGGPLHYNKVDETSCNGTTDYIYYPNGTGADVKDSFVLDLSAVPNGATITKISIFPCASRNDTDVTSSTILNVYYRYGGGTSSLKGNYALSGTTPTPLTGSSWNTSIVWSSATGTLEIGAAFHGGSAGARVSRLRAEIVYTP